MERESEPRQKAKDQAIKKPAPRVSKREREQAPRGVGWFFRWLAACLPGGLLPSHPTREYMRLFAKLQRGVR